MHITIIFEINSHRFLLQGCPPYNLTIGLKRWGYWNLEGELLHPRLFDYKNLSDWVKNAYGIDTDDIPF